MRTTWLIHVNWNVYSEDYVVVVVGGGSGDDSGDVVFVLFLATMMCTNPLPLSPLVRWVVRVSLEFLHCLESTHVCSTVRTLRTLHWSVHLHTFFHSPFSLNRSKILFSKWVELLCSKRYHDTFWTVLDRKKAECLFCSSFIWKREQILLLLLFLFFFQPGNVMLSGS